MRREPLPMPAGLYSIINNLSTGTITNGYGIEVGAPLNTGGGVFTNYYGVYIANPTDITNTWGLYSLAGANYMSGKLGIGVTTPTAPLDVVGAGKFTGAVTAASFAGSGASLTALNASNRRRASGNGARWDGNRQFRGGGSILAQQRDHVGLKHHPEG